MDVTALGVGDAFSSRWYSTCLLVHHEGSRLLIDCPHPIRKVLAESAPGVDLPDIDAIVLTHLHGDHCSGLEGFGFFSHFVLQRPVPLLAWPGVSNRLWERLAPGMDCLKPTPDAPPVAKTLDDYFAVAPLSIHEPTTFGPFTVEARPTKHHVPTTALRITADGATLAYSADTSFDPALITWLDGAGAPADVVIHETNLGTHTPLDDLLSLPASLRDRMRLVHYPDFFDVAGCSIQCLTQGETIAVGPASR
ncbi:MAG: ribonuclease Z [Deltaproteobacteria bacterium]|nr:ribonuclease Z [Deltaproteobacteria bacterium]